MQITKKYTQCRGVAQGVVRGVRFQEGGGPGACHRKIFLQIVSKMSKF